MNRLKVAKLLTQLSPHDLLTKFSKVYTYRVGEGRELSEIPKRVRDLARKLNYGIFPINAEFRLIPLKRSLGCIWKKTLLRRHSE